MQNPHCVCPYLPCKIHGNCQACVQISLKSRSFPNCLENQIEEFGGCLERKYPQNTIVCEDYDGMSQKSADILKEVLDHKKDALIAFSAGMSALGMLEKLVEMGKSGEIDFSRARFVQLDEWLDLEDRSENCSAFLHKNFYDPAGIRPDQLKEFNLDAEDLEAECRKFDEYVKAEGEIDLCILGIGMNGHVALNEPGENFDYGYHVVSLSETTKTVGQKYFSEAKVLTRGMTIGMRQIFDAKKVMLQVAGASKADIIEKLYRTRPQIAIPASVMSLVHDGIVVIDKAAAAKIGEFIK